jgi:hypothetical protein
MNPPTYYNNDQSISYLTANIADLLVSYTNKKDMFGFFIQNIPQWLFQTTLDCLPADLV